MAINNKQRRAAKQRRRPTNGASGAGPQVGSDAGPDSAYAQVQRTLDTFLIVLAGRKIEGPVLARVVRSLLSNSHPHPTALAGKCWTRSCALWSVRS